MLQSPMFFILIGQIRTPAIAVFEKDHISRAVGLLAATRVHRVFVVDNEAKYQYDVFAHYLSLPSALFVSFQLRIFCSILSQSNF